MLHVDTITLQAGLIAGEPWAVLVDAQGGLVAACPPLAIASGRWAPYDDALNVEHFEPASAWLTDTNHTLHIALARHAPQGPTGVLVGAMDYVERTVATTYDGANVEAVEGAFRIRAKSHAQVPTAARGGKPRPRLTNRIDVWI
jgi:hypothetical protein